jgi:hypothetical protein
MNTNENVTKWVDVVFMDGDEYDERRAGISCRPIPRGRNLVMGKSSVTPTYSFVDGRPVHTGYLVLHPDYRLKWSIRGRRAPTPT